MPKETVKSGRIFAHRDIGEEEANRLGVPAGRGMREYDPGAEMREDEIIISQPNLTVTWQKFETGSTPEGGWVQIGVEVDTTAVLERVDGLRKEQKTGDRVYLPLFLSFNPEELSRTEINKMIRVLRRARDQAFGSDE